ncbi:uncharacterized protein Bfra_007240 [Botrytis fragariae]|uniref:Uncharacterized protein n=1 Tax=Botrytis fragariae TaxID=1964551 RepID=A0A8H6AIR0_9HELO|nr:uncharacterized protein Bfra_007240 [Botrytis fragariae]KAF5868045.1 hypothetical protein Bfra_007240 [Botrytis fragariae]
MSNAFALSDSFFSCTRLASDNETTVQKIPRWMSTFHNTAQNNREEVKIRSNDSRARRTLMHIEMHILRTSYASIFFKQLHRIIPVFSIERYLHNASKENFPPKQFKLCVDLFGSAILGHPGKR